MPLCSEKGIKCIRKGSKTYFQGVEMKFASFIFNFDTKLIKTIELSVQRI